MSTTSCPRARSASTAAAISRTLASCSCQVPACPALGWRCRRRRRRSASAHASPLDTHVSYRIRPVNGVVQRPHERCQTHHIDIRQVSDTMHVPPFERRGSSGEVRCDPASGEGHGALRHVGEGLPGRQGGAGRERLHVHAHRPLRGVRRPGQPAHHHARAAQGVQDAPGPLRARRADGLRLARVPEGGRRGVPRPHGDQQPAARRSSTRAAPSTPAGSRPARSTASRRTC